MLPLCKHRLRAVTKSKAHYKSSRLSMCFSLPFFLLKWTVYNPTAELQNSLSYDSRRLLPTKFESIFGSAIWGESCFSFFSFYRDFFILQKKKNQILQTFNATARFLQKSRFCSPFLDFNLKAWRPWLLLPLTCCLLSFQSHFIKHCNQSKQVGRADMHGETKVGSFCLLTVIMLQHQLCCISYKLPAAK